MELQLNTSIVIILIKFLVHLQIPKNLETDDLLLSPLLAYNINQRFRLDTNLNVQVDFEMVYSQEEEKFKVTFIKDDIARDISSEFLGGIIMALSDDYFQRYALDTLRKRRRDPKLSLRVTFRRGRVDPEETSVQAV